MTPVLMGISIALLARSFYVIYTRKRASRPIKILTWLSAAFVVSFWTWWLITGPESLR
jgi:hypothetical protein